jgi:hypothetical protein
MGVPAFCSWIFVSGLDVAFSGSGSRVWLRASSRDLSPPMMSRCFTPHPLWIKSSANPSRALLTDYSTASANSCNYSPFSWIQVLCSGRYAAVSWRSL